VRKAIDEFTTPKSTRDPYKEPRKEEKIISVNRTHPIPGKFSSQFYSFLLADYFFITIGFTGFIPGSKYGFATTFGKTTEIAYENFNHRDNRGRIVHKNDTQVPVKHLAKSQPIPGYRGHSKMILIQI
jgi:hypothetical protein